MFQSCAKKRQLANPRHALAILRVVRHAPRSAKESQESRILSESEIGYLVLEATHIGKENDWCFASIHSHIVTKIVPRLPRERIVENDEIVRI